MEQQSTWLGPLRQPIRYLMFALIAVTVITAVWALADLSSRDGLNQFKPSFAVTSFKTFLIIALAAMFTSGIYLSDTIGAIEPKPEGFFDVLSLVCARVAMIGIVFVVLVMFYEVVSRYVFNKPTLWANELSLWIAGFVFLFAGQYAMQQRSHIRIYIIYDMMPRWAQKTSDMISVFLIWVFAFALVWGGYKEAHTKLVRMETFGTAWDPPIPGTIKVAILFIICLVAVQALSNLIADWHKAPEHHSPADEIDEAEIENIRKTLR